MRLLSPNTWSLRTRLMVGQVIMLMLVCVGVGITTEIALRHYLVGQLDTTVREAVHRSMVMSDHPPPDRPNRPRRQRPGPGPEFLDAPGQPSGLVTMVVRADGSVTAGALATDGSRVAVTDRARDQLKEAVPGAAPLSTDLDGKGSYRIAAEVNRQGETIIAGLPLSGVNSTMWRVLVTMVVVTLAALVAATTLGIAITRRALAPLTRVAATAREVANLPLDRGEVALPVRVPESNADPNTEVGQMGSALNRMLDHIGTALSTRQASETRVRQFVADASHELRTPLAAIRGYTELAHRHRDEVPEQVAHAMGRVESEAGRMTHLVEDLLLLARLDSGRPLDQEQIDLSQIAVDAVSDAHVAGPDHDWQIDLPDDPVLVTGDGARLHQVLVNLLANARVHTPPGTVVSVAVTVDGPQAVLTVTDDGPGIDRALIPEVFTRFARGDSSRSRNGGGTGLGLSIVDAVVRAHHGTITLRSEPGATEFVVRLPRSTANA
ncbi:sensor histidine kinase [Gordonia crocea]|uniref:histidine kinase n=1 Tax=Gordonia crocea TaxID=589162 RepID=A0A7I9UVP0_9ACTN|nr:HAMP domain-containing sensor histidine kinase [Gordonia crocea]GED97012.1 two-component sensor histidine kinase [Gordonia crocea]